MRRKKVKLADLLSSWDLLNQYAAALTEEQCVTLINLEKRGKHRTKVLLRLLSRMNKVRYEREQAELIKEVL